MNVTQNVTAIAPLALFCGLFGVLKSRHRVLDVGLGDDIVALENAASFPARARNWTRCASRDKWRTPCAVRVGPTIHRTLYPLTPSCRKSCEPMNTWRSSSKGCKCESPSWSEPTPTRENSRAHDRTRAENAPTGHSRRWGEVLLDYHRKWSLTTWARVCEDFCN